MTWLLPSGFAGRGLLWEGRHNEYTNIHADLRANTWEFKVGHKAV